jgi:hypothetical protein
LKRRVVKRRRLLVFQSSQCEEEGLARNEARPVAEAPQIEVAGVVVAKAALKPKLSQ